MTNILCACVAMAVNILAETSEKLLKVALSCKVISGIIDDSDCLPPQVALQRFVKDLRLDLQIMLILFLREKANLFSSQMEILERLELSA